MIEYWKNIPDFSDYAVSSDGRIMNVKTEQMRNFSVTNQGDYKVTLYREGKRCTRSVRMLVAEAFVFKPNKLFDSVISLDNDKNNLSASNLEWRPNWFAWKYHNQFKEYFPDWYYYVHIQNVSNNKTYFSIISTAQTDGVLCKDVADSVRSGKKVFPHWDEYREY